MNEPTPIDRIRLRAQGRLAPAEAQALERELAADPALRRLADDFALVHAVTALEAAEVGARTSFEELEPRLEGPAVVRPGWRRSAAAVLALAAGAVGYWLGTRAGDAPAETSELRLVAIELDRPLMSASLTPDLPNGWAGFQPRGERGVRFLSDLGAARELAQMSGRPLLVYGSFPGCPLCAELDRTVFADPDVVDLAERTVPVRIDMAQLASHEQRSYMARGYPFLEVWRSDGRPAHPLVRVPDPLGFLESLHDGLAASDATGEPLEWSLIVALGERFQAARAAELEGRTGEAQREFRALALDARVPGEIAMRSSAGLQRLASEARERLLAAREVAERDLALAQRQLGEARAHFAGSTFELDFAAAAEFLARDGRFPRLVESEPDA
jgi:hypothetical protein